MAQQIKVFAAKPHDLWTHVEEGENQLLEVVS